MKHSCWLVFNCNVDLSYNSPLLSGYSASSFCCCRCWYIFLLKRVFYICIRAKLCSYESLWLNSLFFFFLALFLRWFRNWNTLFLCSFLFCIFLYFVRSENSFIRSFFLLRSKTICSFRREEYFLLSISKHWIFFYSNSIRFGCLLFLFLSLFLFVFVFFCNLYFKTILNSEQRKKKWVRNRKTKLKNWKKK